MATIRIDGQQYEVEAGKNLLETCLTLGLDLPYFCWHPAMGSVGACRQCALVQYLDEESEQAGRGRVVMGCMTPVTDGAIFSLEGDRARQFREAIVESLMLNHPHDCPVCAEGGECHLQDMTVMVGHRDRHDLVRDDVRSSGGPDQGVAAADGRGDRQPRGGRGRESAGHGHRTTRLTSRSGTCTTLTTLAPAR